MPVKAGPSLRGSPRREGPTWWNATARAGGKEARRRPDVRPATGPALLLLLFAVLLLAVLLLGRLVLAVGVGGHLPAAVDLLERDRLLVLLRFFLVLVLQLERDDHGALG